METHQAETEQITETIKNEPVTKEVESDAVQEEPDFLDELLHSAGDIAAAIAEADTSISNTQVKPEPDAKEDEVIDPNFFDEILVCEDDECQKLPKIRDKRIKREKVELEEGEVDDDDNSRRKHKNGKSKKSKKSKRRKSKEFPQKIKTEKDDSSSTTNTNVPRIQVRAELRSFREPTPTSPQTNEENEVTSEQSQAQIETHIGNSRRYQPIPYQLSILQDEPVEQKPEKELTAEEKLCKALECVIYVKRAFQKSKLQKEKQFSENNPVFVYTPTVRKLPTSFSHFTQNIYDNRSPLHTVNNVTFQFNSMATRLNLEEWGLESLPPKARVVAKTLGYDVDTLFDKRQRIKIPDKIQKNNENTSKNEEKELCEKSHSTLFMNVMVQTDDVKIIPNRRRGFYRDKGLQFTPSTNVVGTQTNPIYTGSSADLPLFNIIRKLNENQLEAVDDFLQLILEPASDSSLDVYQQRKRLADIYKTSQIPAEARPSHKRSADEAGFSERMPSPPPPPNMYKHRDFIKKEPRESNSYHQSSNERRRSQSHSRRNFNSPKISRNADLSDDEPTPSVKFYGRGGMRR